MMKRSVLAVAAGVMVWSQGVGADFSQQGSKLTGTGATGSAWQASATAVSAAGETATSPAVVIRRFFVRNSRRARGIRRNAAPTPTSSAAWSLQSPNLRFSSSAGVLGIKDASPNSTPV